MQVNVSNIVFNFSTTTPGQVDSANFTFYGSDAQTIARQKLLKYLALPNA